jgi:peroxiredoxin family protein
LPPPPGEEASPGLSLLVFSGDFARVHYALVLASSAAAIGRPATLFFAGGAVEALRKPDADGMLGWRRMTAANGTSAGVLDDGYARAGVATFETLLGACTALGVRFLVCEMALRLARLDPVDLRADVALEVTGAVSLLAATPAGAALVMV